MGSLGLSPRSFPNLFLSSDMGRRIVQDILGSDVKASADSSFLQV